MQEMTALIVGGVGLAFVIISTVVMEHFKRRSLHSRGIVRADLRSTTWRIVKLTILSWTILSALLLVLILIADEPGSTFYTSGVTFCLLGFTIFAALLLAGYFGLLWGWYRLPLIDDGQDWQTEHPE